MESLIKRQLNFRFRNCLISTRKFTAYHAEPIEALIKINIKWI
jgi:hypothetical protein